MSTTPEVDPAKRADAVQLAKTRLRQGRQRIAQRHAAGQNGWTTAANICDLFFGVLLDCWDAAARDAKLMFPKANTRITLAPTGGLGRRDVAPYSDLDVMILHEPGDEERVGVLSQRLLQDVFDSGLQLSLAVRTVKQACTLAAKDAEIVSSLTDARFLAGSIGLFREFLTAFQTKVRKRPRGLREMVMAARDAERERYGGTVYLLEPDVKRSRGGLRDAQLLRWIAGIWHGTAEPKDLVKAGHLAADVRRELAESVEFILRVRHDMHFHARSAHDLLDRSEQLRIATERGIEGAEGLLPVEEFMRTYFFHTDRIGRIAARFVDSAGPARKVPSVLARIFMQHVGGDYRIEPAQISATPQGLARLQTAFAEVVRVAGLTATYNRRIAPETSEAALAVVANAPPTPSPETCASFLTLLDQPVRLGQALRSLYDLRALEPLVPAFGHARGLLQFNAYHKYTVDEHSLRAVEAATDFMADPGTLGRIYRGLPRKYLLHLALLIHDLGKGYPEDHSEIGARIAVETAARLGLNDADADALRFLVHKHLLMSHTAFRRDTSDPQQVLQFAFDVGSPDLLQMLYVFTAADFQAVGPGVLNDWKISVLTGLYLRTMSHLSGDSPTPIEQLREARAAIRAALEHGDLDPWIDREIDALPSSFLSSRLPEEIAQDLAVLHRLEPGELYTHGVFRKDAQTLEFTVGVREPQPENALSRLSGALSGKGIQIHTVEAHALLDERVVYRFLLQDAEGHANLREQRVHQLERELREAMTDEAYRPTAARRVWRTAARKRVEALRSLPVQVRADIDTSPNYTILDVFAPDQLALFYQVAKTLESFKLRVALAKMSAYLDQALGVFYVTDRQGRKLEDQLQIQALKTKLISRLEGSSDAPA